MKELIIIPGIFPDKVSAELYEALLAIYPEARARGFLDIRLPKEDPRITQTLQIFHERGFSPGDRYHELKENEFSLEIRRLYDARDYEEAPYLVPKPKTSLGSTVFRNDAGLIQLEGRNLKTDKDIGFAFSFWVVVSKHIKEKIEQSDLKHIVFRPTEILGSGSQRLAGHYWEMTSDLCLTPLAPYSQLTTNDGQPFVGNYDNGCLYLEGLYEQPEFHYKGSDMEALAAAEPFDMALTQERFGIREWVCDPCLVASPRFYKFCVANKLRMNWMPVRLEAE